MTKPVLAARGISKTFGGRTVLADADIDVLPGEVLGLLGQNGSGKSTFIKILSGYHPPDAGGELWINGEPISLPLAPGDPPGLGMAFVHQDLGLAEPMTVLENIRAGGSYETRFGWRIPWRREQQRARALLERFDVRVSPNALVSELRDVDRAMVAILRALEPLQGARTGVLVLDEPTAYLPRDGVDRLFAAVREITAMGLGVIFVSHRLDEVQAITDRVTILRDGRVAAAAATEALSERQLIEHILGRTLDELYPEPHDVGGEVVLSARGISGRVVRAFDLDMRQGEVVGLTGLLGMGQEEILYLLFGAQRAVGGTITIAGTTLPAQRMTPREAIASRIALLPGNRLRDGGTRLASVAENVTLPTVGRHFRGGRLRRGAEVRSVHHLLERFAVTPPDPARMFGTLSGGNQQKALLAKWFETRPAVLLAHEPTQGVDIGAKRQIFELIRDAAQGGQSILIASTEYEDLAHICDRVVVFRDGAAIASLSGAELTSDRIVEQCFRSSVANASDRHRGKARTT
jgi:ribose transport system ATP-binding protein